MSSIEMRGITMAFGTNEVLKGIDLTIEPGEVTAMLGANGAGKSTLIKVLSGVNAGYGGQILIDGAEVRIDSPSVARAHGIQAVQQKIAAGVVPGLSVAENLLFEGIVNGQVPRSRSLRGLIAPARAMTDVLELDWSDDVLRADVYDLPIADQQLLLLCRALAVTPRLLILDEPTSALSATEADRLFDVIRTLREQGVAIFYVSHRLAEMDAIADRLLVLRDGVILSEQRPPFDWSAALHDMLDDDSVDDDHPHDEMRGTDEVLQLHGVQLQPRSAPFDLTIRSGEVTGVFGLLGSGGSELAHGIFGSTHFVAGRMTLDGEPFAPRSPADAIARNIFMVHEDRMAAAIVADWSLAMTSTFPFLDQTSRWAVLDHRAEADVGDQVIEEYGVVAQSPHDSMLSLSGGNQQKVVVGRWLRQRPTVMLLNEPFQGVDVGARRDLINKAREVAASGSAVVVVSTNLEEIMQVADRVIELADGNLRFDAYLSETSKAELLQKLSEVA